MALNGSPEKIRAQVDGLVQILLPQMPAPNDACDVKEGDVGGIKRRLYMPKETAKGGPLPSACGHLDLRRMLYDRRSEH